MSDLFFGEFSTDVTPPEVTNPSPGNGLIGVARDADIEFDITDTETGVDTTAVIVYIGGVKAYDGGAGGFQAGYITGSTFLDMGGGTWHMLINPAADLGSYVLVAVTVDGHDLAPVANVMSQYSWSFTTIDDEAPYVQNNTPTGPDTPVTALIEFDLKDDGLGVDVDSLNVTVGGVAAIVGGAFVSPFDGLSSAITGTPASYHVVIDANPDYDEWTTYEVIVNARDLA